MPLGFDSEEVRRRGRDDGLEDLEGCLFLVLAIVTDGREEGKAVEEWMRRGDEGCQWWGCRVDVVQPGYTPVPQITKQSYDLLLHQKSPTSKKA